MFLDKVDPFWTEEDERRDNELIRQQDELLQQVDTTIHPNEKWVHDEEWSKKWRAIQEERDLLEIEVINRYYDSLKTKEDIFRDMEDVANALEKEDFLSDVKFWQGVEANLLMAGAEVSGPIGAFKSIRLETAKRKAREDYEACFSFVFNVLARQVDALYINFGENANPLGATPEGNENHDRITRIIDKCVSRWYIKPAPDFLPMAHGRATDALALMSSRDAVLDEITGTATITRAGVVASIRNFEKLQESLGIREHQLLSVALSQLSAQNHFTRRQGGPVNHSVSFSLKEYLNLQGKNTIAQEKSTPEETEKEKRRVENLLKDERKKITKSLNTLFKIDMSWKGTGKDSGDFEGIHVLDYVACKKGIITIDFSPRMARYLAGLPLTQYPVGLLRCDPRDPTQYQIGLKLSQHYNNDNNQARGTADILKVETILSWTNLPTPEKLAKNRHSWEDRIKEPMEKALDGLVKCGVLSNWEYTHAKKVPLTDKEAQEITDYNTFRNLYVTFQPGKTVSNTERLARREEEKARAEEKAKKNKRKKH